MPQKQDNKSHGSKKTTNKGQSELNLIDFSHITDDNLINCQIYTNDFNVMDVQVLLDTGAKRENYVSKRVAE